MSAVAERPITITEVPLGPVTEKDACALALSYLRWSSACWRGDTLAPVFATQLGAYWRPHCRHCRRAKPMPSARTVAVDAASIGITPRKRFSDTFRERLVATRCRSRPSHSSYVAPTRVRAWPRAGRRMNSGSFGLKCGETRYYKSEQT